MPLLTPHRYDARSHVVLAVDIVGSSQASDDLLDPMKTEMEQVTSQALGMSGVRASDARHFRETGDGLMLAYPETSAGPVTEVVFYIDHLLRARNRYNRVPMRARVAVHAGPMSDQNRYHRNYITLTRLLNASSFTEAVGNWCQRDPDGQKFGAAAVYSNAVWRNVIEPFYVAYVPPARCSQISVVTPDFADNAWIYFPGLDSDSAVNATQPPQTAPPLSPDTFGVNEFTANDHNGHTVRG